MRRRLPWALSALLAVLAVPALAGPAAEPCELALREAEAAYQAGAFDAALRSLAPCLDAAHERAERAAALALKAKVELAADDVAAARVTTTELLRLEPAFAVDTLKDSPRFARLVERVREASTTVEVSSVSKSPESLRLAPATVVVVTAEEIARRGYRDLEAVLGDLPGFDISRTNGATYSNIYQRGHISVETNRTLVLVDGVEENDLFSQTVYLTRQFPLSNVERVEVVYGPASTMYGSNALAGVINVITRKPSAVGGRSAEGARGLATDVRVAGGSLGTKSVDATAAWRGDTASFTLTGRAFHSDELDLSRFAAWDYDLDRAPYESSLRIDGDGVAAFASFLTAHPELDCRGRTDCAFAFDPKAGGAVELTAAGRRRALELDRPAYSRLNGRPVAFSDPTDDWGVHGKLELPNLELAFETWRVREGATPWFTDLFAPGGDNGETYSPSQSWIYLKYARPLSSTLSLTLFGTYKLHRLAEPSVLQDFAGYANGTLGLTDLLQEREPSWKPTYYYLSNSQLRSEARLVYEPSDRFSLVSGIELRSSSLQGDYITSSEPHPAETGKPASTIAGGNQFQPREAALYAQAAYRLRPNLKVVAGGRVDQDQVRLGGYGTVFNPRLALVYDHGPFVFKSIYAEAFQDAPNFMRYGTTDRRALANPDLAPEKVKNLELAASYSPNPALTFELAAYEARYTGIAQEVSGVPCATCPTPVTRQFQAIGALRVRGLQATAAARLGRLDLHGNYTHTEPVDTDPRGPDGGPLRDSSGRPLGRRTIGDIAADQANLGADLPLTHHLLLNTRLNLVGAKGTGGAVVTAEKRPRLDPYAVAHLALTYQDLLPGVGLQLAVDNLFDATYESPGVRAADGFPFANAIPQPGRIFTLRLQYTHHPTTPP